MFSLPCGSEGTKRDIKPEENKVLNSSGCRAPCTGRAMAAINESTTDRRRAGASVESRAAPQSGCWAAHASVREGPLGSEGVWPCLLQR